MESSTWLGNAWSSFPIPSVSVLAAASQSEYPRASELSSLPVPSVGVGSVPGFPKVVKTLSIEGIVLSEALGQGDFDPDSVKDLGCAPLVPSVGLTLWVGLRH